MERIYWWNRTDVNWWQFQGNLWENNIASHIIQSLSRRYDRSRDAGVKACWSWSNPQMWSLENINPAVSVQVTVSTPLYGSWKKWFPCWCVLIRLELVGPATACLVVDLERRDYLLQLLSSLLPPPNATVIKVTDDTGSVSHSSQLGSLVLRCVQPTGHWAESKQDRPGDTERCESLSFTQCSWQ